MSTFALRLLGYRVVWCAEVEMGHNLTSHAGFRDQKHPHYASLSSRAFASFKSNVSKPSVNQP